MYTRTRAIILAAGKGKRLNSEKPKALHDLCGKPLIGYIVETLKGLDIVPHIVIGHQGEAVRAALGESYTYANQAEQWGTGHAALCALPTIPPHITTVAVFNCDDSAFYRAETLERLLKTHAERLPKIAMMTVTQDDPTGLGRIIRNGARDIIDIREERLASLEEKKIKEINTGVYVFDREFLENALPRVERSAVGEYFINDLVGLALKTPQGVTALTLENKEEFVSINTPEQLEQARLLMAQRLTVNLT